jgi:hypothetical protein
MTAQTTLVLSTISGRIQALRRAAGTVNLLEDMQKGAFASGIAAAVSGQAGMVANAASLALYDGEDVEHIALLINGQLAVGTFEWLEDIKVDDEVKLVVSQIKDGPLFVHAILREKDQLLWLPYSVDHTRWGSAMYMVKLCTLVLVLTLIFIALLQWFSPAKDVWNVVRWWGGSLLIIAIVGFLSNRDMMSLGQQAEDIFEALGVQKFKRFRINPYSLMMDRSMSDRHRKGCIYKFTEALAAHKKKFGLA